MNVSGGMFMVAFSLLYNNVFINWQIIIYSYNFKFN